ncbi:MAG: hypothetical protein ACMXYL_00465 [Candidatus Woesearchaeota archaeon]
MRIVVWFLLIVLLSGVVYAGVLTGTRSVGPEGTTFTLCYRQGCSTGSLGPNQCHPTNQPRWCPLDSTGNTALRNNASYCNCPIHFEPDDDGINCRACRNPCERCPDDYSCTSPTTDWCTTDPTCIPPVPVFVGYARFTSNRASCPELRGQYLYGVPRSDGTYGDCFLFSRVCDRGDGLRSSGVILGHIMEVCPDGYTDIYGGFRTTGLITVQTGTRCRSEDDCTSGAPSPPEFPPDCTGPHQCPDVPNNMCDGSYAVRTMATGICVSGSCYTDTPYEITRKDCSQEYCFGIPMICNNGFCSCV